MAIAPDSFGGSMVESNSNTYSVNVTNTAGTFMTVDLHVGKTGTLANPTTITYNGVSLGSPIGAANATEQRIMRYILQNPATGTNALSVTYPTGGTFFSRGAIVRTYTGVHPDTPTGTVVTATGSGTAISVNVSAAVGDLVTDAVFGFDVSGTGNFAPGAGQTEDGEIATGATGGAGTRETAAGTTVTMSQTCNDTLEQWLQIACALKPASEGGGISIPVVMHHRMRNF